MGIHKTRVSPNENGKIPVIFAKTKRKAALIYLLKKSAKAGISFVKKSIVNVIRKIKIPILEKSVKLFL